MTATPHWKCLVCLPLAVFMLLLSSTLAMAECALHYEEARTMLDEAQKRILDNDKPDPDAFSTDFQKAVDKLQEEQCLSELMSLLQHIQQEQKKYPLPTDAPGSIPDVHLE